MRRVFTLKGYRVCAYRSLLVLALASVQVLSAPPPKEQINETLQDHKSRYQRTVLAVQRASAQTQTDFATTALRELIEAYIAEADLARNQAAQEGGSEKLLGWSGAVDRYAAQLLLLLDDIDLGFPAEVSAGSPGGASVSVAGRLIILNHPRADQETAFEQRVLQDFCARHDCQSMTATAVSPDPIPLTGSQVKTRWTFEEDGPVCRHEGLALYFGTMRNLVRSRSICEQLMQEASTLAGELAWQRRHGVTVDWQGLEIRPTPRRPEHLVILNKEGHSILATLPLLYGSPAALRDLKPWIDARFSGGLRPAVALQAADYGWESATE